MSKSKTEKIDVSSLLPTNDYIFKSKNPISNLNVNLNLLPPGIVELELNLKKLSGVIV